MREMITKVYNFNELSDEAKEKAIEAHRYDFVNGWSDENWASIQAIAKACSLEVVSNNYNDTGFSRFVLEVNDYNNYYDIAALRGRRAVAYIYNNWIKPNINGKYYATPGKWINGVYTYTHTRSKCTFEFSCPFTGYCVDDCLIHAYKKFCEYVRINPLFDVGDFVDVLSECVSEFLQNDYNYSISDENIAELLTANNYEFLENGVDYK